MPSDAVRRWSAGKSLWPLVIAALINMVIAAGSGKTVDKVLTAGALECMSKCGTRRR